MTTKSVFLCDGYADVPTDARAVLEERIRQLKFASWADPGDRELRQEIERLQDELRALDGGTSHG